jgi:hypothetical protein
MVLSLFSLALGACASIHWKRPVPSPEQARYLDRALFQPLDLEVPHEQGDAAWSRAQVFAAHYCPLKIELATNYVCFTFTDTQNYSWRFTRELRGATDLISVECLVPDKAEHPCQESFASSRNARVAARFIATGERIPDGLIWPALRSYDEKVETRWNPALWGQFGDPWGDFECAKPADQGTGQAAATPAPSPTATPAPFAPSVGMVEPSVIFSYLTQGHAVLKPKIGSPDLVRSWTFSVAAPSGGKALRTLRGDGRVPATLEWNGRDDKGNFEAEGTYAATLEVAYANGQRASFSQIRLEIDNNFPRLKWERLAASLDPVRPDLILMPAQFGIEPSPTRLPCHYRLEVRRPDGTLMRTLTGSVKPGLQVAWDGKDDQGDDYVAGKHYIFKLSLLDVLDNLVMEYPQRDYSCVPRP